MSMREYPARILGSVEARENAESIARVIAGFYKELERGTTPELASALAEELGKELINLWMQG